MAADHNELTQTDVDQPNDGVVGRDRQRAPGLVEAQVTDGHGQSHEMPLEDSGRVREVRDRVVGGARGEELTLGVDGERGDCLFVLLLRWILNVPWLSVEVASLEDLDQHVGAACDELFAVRRVGHAATALAVSGAHVHALGCHCVERWWLSSAKREQQAKGRKEGPSLFRRTRAPPNCRLSSRTLTVCSTMFLLIENPTKTLATAFMKKNNNDQL